MATRARRGQHSKQRLLFCMIPMESTSVLSKRKLFFALLAVFIVGEVTIVGMNKTTFNKTWNMPLQNSLTEMFSLKSLNLGSSSYSGSGTGDSGASGIESGTGTGSRPVITNLDDETAKEIGDMAYPAEARLRLHNMYPENYKDNVERYEKLLHVQKT